MQRRIIVAASLYGLLVAASWLMPEVAVHGNQAMDAFSLLAIGFLIVCAYASGDIAHAMGIPRITAYLLTGFILGPNVIGIVPQNAIGPVLWYPNDALIQPLTMLAVSLIALRAGSVMSLQTMLSGGKALFSIIAGQLVGILIITAAATVFLLQSAGTLLDLPVAAPNIPPLLLGALVAVLCWGGSVASTVNLLDETGARGPVGKQVINSAALRDLFAVIAFALVLPALNTADSTESAIGLHVLSSTALSIVFGIVIGSALITIRRVTQQDTPLLTLSLVLVCGLLMSAQAPFGPFLIFLIAGFILGNFGRQGPQVVSSLGPIANVVYVVFFASLGVSFSEGNWLAVSVFSVTIFLARWAGLYVGSLAGIRVANLRAPNAAVATNSSLPQAGVAVALAILLGEALPGWGPFIRDGLLGAILIAEFVGPTFLLRVLHRTGEAAAIDDPDQFDEDELLSPYERVIKVGPDLPAPPAQMSKAASHGLATIRKGIQVEMDNFADSLAEALADGPFRYLS
ncbi:MAG TPA: hypothetical protein EYN06_00915, partial [Myxococcales bacterium]|nr:hypothetical protein [Myxococcales bacterium]